MLLKLLLYAGVIKCRCRFIGKLKTHNMPAEFYYNPLKCPNVHAIPDEWLNAEVVEIFPGEYRLDIYVK